MNTNNTNYNYPNYPWERDWSQFYIYHWHMCDYDWTTQEPVDGLFGLPDVEKTLEQIKRIDKVTRGIPKVVVLIGWQKFVSTPGGTAPWDCQWPSFVTTSGLFGGYGDKYRDNIDDNPANAAIRWLMKKAREECNTYATFHTNFNGVQPHSKHWETYAEKDLLCKDADGNLRYDEYIRGYVILQKAFETGEWQKRIAEIIKTFPEILTTKLLHNDWNWNMYSEAHNYTQNDSMAALRKCMEHIKKTYQVDTSCELVSHDPLKPECDYGMQCRALSFERKDSLANPDRMKTPAYVLTGGNGGYNDLFDVPEFEDLIITSEGMTIKPKRLHFSNETLLFGATNQGNEGRYYTAGMEDAPEYKKYAEANPNALFRDFCYGTLPFYYLNRLLRVDADKTGERYTEIRYSDGVRSYINSDKFDDDNVIIEKDKGGINGQKLILRDGNNIFMPELWKRENKEIMAWSDNGYLNREWVMPVEWENILSVDLYGNTVLGVKLRQPDVKIIGGKIKLSLDKYDGVLIVPHGSDPDAKEPGYIPSGKAEFVKTDINYTPAKANPPVKADVKIIGGEIDKEVQLHEIIDVDCGENAIFATIYMIDKNNQNCQVMLDVIDAYSNDRIGESKLLNSYENGIYITYKITGHVRFRITRFHYDGFGKADGSCESGRPSFSGLFFDA